MRGAIYGLTAAILFGVSAPFSKLLLTRIEPLMLSAILYLGAGIALGIVTPFARRRDRGEAPLRRSDLPMLAAITVAGGVVGPLMMLIGLHRVSAVAGSLLLNLETPLTIAIAVVIFGEHLSRSEAIAAAVIVLGAIVLAWQPGEVRFDLFGFLAIAAACASWGLDNNWTQRLTLRDPVALVRVKTLGAGACSLVIALALGQRLPAMPLIGAALTVGALSYGISILLDTMALRTLGAAREAVFFATAPFIGAIAAVPIVGDRIGAGEAVAIVMMAVGLAALLSGRHEHEHRHAEIAHEHVHVHDEHHQHAHPEADPPGESHSHPHRHDPVVHAHPHVSDVHHRHEH